MQAYNVSYSNIGVDVCSLHNTTKNHEFLWKKKEQNYLSLIRKCKIYVEKK